MECSLEAIIEAGDHAIFLAEVMHTESHMGSPLIYFQRGYRSMAQHNPT